LISVDEALARILAAFAPLPTTRVAIDEAVGLVLADDIVASTNLPPFTNSAMDGFAIRSVDTVGASTSSPTHFTLIGQAAPGTPSDRTIRSGEAVKIMTGAMVPPGADAVIRFEDVAVPSDAPNDPATIVVNRRVPIGENVRPLGEDVRTGATVLAAGARIGVAEIALLGALGLRTVAVHRRPRVAILSTGDELTPLGEPLHPGMIYDSNSYALSAMVRRFGGIPTNLGIAQDNIADLHHRLDLGQNADLVVTSGGVSVGDYDLVKEVLRSEGDIGFWQVRMKPGKPLAFGRLGAQPLLGLPGNPVAAIVAFLQFGRPSILKMLGRLDLSPPIVSAGLTEAVSNPGGRRHFIRVNLTHDPVIGYVAAPVRRTGSAVLSSMTGIDGLLVIPETVAVAEPGMRFAVQLIDGLGG